MKLTKREAAWAVKDYTVFDLETTGLSRENDKIIEIAAIKVRDHKITSSYQALVNPEMPIPKEASKVNGITDLMVVMEPTIEHVLPEFMEFIGKDILIGHNIKDFDMKFIEREAKEIGMSVKNAAVDTKEMAKALLRLQNNKLITCAKHYGVGEEQTHRSLSDCEMNQKVYEHMCEEISNAEIIAKPVCPQCGSELVIRDGKNGKFVGCTGYPNCRYTRNAKDEDFSILRQIVKRWYR